MITTLYTKSLEYSKICLRETHTMLDKIEFKVSIPFLIARTISILELIERDITNTLLI